MLVVAVHLCPHTGGAARRKEQMQGITKFVDGELLRAKGLSKLSVGAAAVMGDMNVRNTEAADLLEIGSWCEARYQGSS